MGKSYKDTNNKKADIKIKAAKNSRKNPDKTIVKAPMSSSAFFDDYDEADE